MELQCVIVAYADSVCLPAYFIHVSDSILRQRSANTAQCQRNCGTAIKVLVQSCKPRQSPWNYMRYELNARRETVGRALVWAVANQAVSRVGPSACTAGWLKTKQHCPIDSVLVAVGGIQSMQTLTIDEHFHWNKPKLPIRDVFLKFEKYLTEFSKIYETCLNLERNISRL